MTRIAELTGTFIVPGVSKNGRLYTAEHSRRAVERMKARIADPTGRPITMLTHHGAGDDSTRIAARVTDAWVDENNVAHWRADVADNDSGRSIAALTTPDQPYLANVSLRGWWLGEPRTVMHGGEAVETGDDIEVDGIDFTKNPGVDGARITAAVAETGRTPITESLEVRLMTETATTETVYADPGYLGGVKALPLGTRAEIRAAWATVQTTEAYTPNQSKRIRARVKAAADKAGFDVVTETNEQIAVVTEALEEAYASMSLDSGGGEVRVAGYVPDPSDLAAVARKVALAALAAQSALDPDADGDIDLDTTETTPAAPAVEETPKKENDMADETKASPASVPAPPKPLAEMDETELRAYATACQEFKPEPAETTSAGTETATTTETKPEEEDVDKATLTKADVATIVAETVKALKEPVAETTAAVETTETVDPNAALKDEIRKEILAEMAPLIGRSGFRKGLVRAEENAPAKPPHEMTDEEFRAFRNDTLGTILPS